MKKLAPLQRKQISRRSDEEEQTFNIQTRASRKEKQIFEIVALKVALQVDLKVALKADAKLAVCARNIHLSGLDSSSCRWAPSLCCAKDSSADDEVSYLSISMNFCAALYP